jgi:MFS family permease
MPLSAGIVIASIACYRLIARLGRRLVLIGFLVTLAGTAHLLTLVAVSGTDTGSWALVPPLLVIGLGMGACFGSLYDVTIGDIAPAEAGSAGGSLGAVQQLANATGAAAVTTVYFRAGGGETHATTVSLVVVAAITLLCCPLVRLLPLKAQEEQHH